MAYRKRRRCLKSSHWFYLSECILRSEQEDDDHYLRELLDNPREHFIRLFRLKDQCIITMNRPSVRSGFARLRSWLVSTQLPSANSNAEQHVWG